MDIKWKLHLKSPIVKVFDILSTDNGRKKFWAESAIEKDGYIQFKFSNGDSYKSKALNSQSPNLYEIDYFSTNVLFRLKETKTNGTDLMLLNTNIPSSEYSDTKAGWVSVLLALKCAVDFGIDIRNHNVSKTWNQLYVDN